jgi:hypothetical protein
MNTLRTKSTANPLLNTHEEEILATLLHPMFMTLILALGIGVGGAVLNILVINGSIPGNGTDDVWNWARVWVGSIVGFLSLLGMVFLKPLALKFIASARAKNVPAAS